MKRRRVLFGIVIVLMIFAGIIIASQSRITGSPPHVFAANDPKSLPLPTSGYDVYLVGEGHGTRETKAVFFGYLSRLVEEGSLRDVVLEEDSVYEEEAQAFVEGKRNELPVGLCLRADVLNGLRDLNRGLAANKKIRVHLIDIDSPEQAIRQHLLRLKDLIGTSAEGIEVSEGEEFSVTTTKLIVERLAELTTDRKILAGLRTIRQSLIAFEDGFRSHIGPVRGNPAHPAREEAIAANLLDVSRTVQPGPVLGLYGSAHVQKGTRLFPDAAGGEFVMTPMSDRLERAGIRVYRTICYPLAGSLVWRQMAFKLPAGPAASDFKLSNGATVAEVLANAPECEFFYFDLTKGIPLSVQTRRSFRGVAPDDPGEQFDSFIFLREATPIRDQCPSVKE